MTRKKIKDNINRERAVYGDAYVQQYKSDVAFKSLVQGVEEDLYVIPDFQRVFKWKFEQVEDLAISLVQGMPIPPIYAYRNENNQLQILDGQQRVLSMYLYYKGKFFKDTNRVNKNFKKFSSDKLQFLKDLGNTFELIDRQFFMHYYTHEENEEIEKVMDITYSNLPDAVRRKLDYTTITVIEININDDSIKEKYLHKIFANLNAGGTQLESQEIRNGIYKCKFYQELYKFNSENIQWSNLLGKNRDESNDTEFLLRLCALRYYVKFINDKYTLKNYPNISKFLNDFSYESLSFSDDEVSVYFNELDYFFSMFKGKISKKNIQVTLFECLYAVLLPAFGDVILSEKLIADILIRDDYRKTIKQGSASVVAIEEKMRVIFDELQKQGFKSN